MIASFNLPLESSTKNAVFPPSALKVTSDEVIFTCELAEQIYTPALELQLLSVAGLSLRAYKYILTVEIDSALALELPRSLTLVKAIVGLLNVVAFAG